MLQAYSISKSARNWNNCLYQRCNRSGFSRPDPTGKIQNLLRLTGSFIEGLCSVFNKPNDKLHFTLTLSLDV